MSGWRNSAPSVFFTGWDFSVLTTTNLVKYLLLQYEIVSLLRQFLSLHFQCQKILLFLFSTFWCSAPLPLQDESLPCEQSFDKLDVAKFRAVDIHYITANLDTFQHKPIRLMRKIYIPKLVKYVQHA